MPLRAPNDVSIEALFASITVTDNEGRERPVRPFAIVCERAKLSDLEPGASVSASVKVFWSTAGFAFGRPGRYRVDVAVMWSARGVAVGVQNGVDVFVDYPTSDADNSAADLVLHPDVGKWVALGGEAYHLGEAGRRLLALSESAAPAGLAAGGRDVGAPSRVVAGFADLMPSRTKLAKLYPGIMDAGAGAATRRARSTRGSTTTGRAKRASKGRGRTGRRR